MKKVLFFVMLLFSITTVMAEQSSPAIVNAEGFTEVWDAQQLKAAIQENNSAKIQLMKDIDAAKIGTICSTFSGTITGKHRTYSSELQKEIDAMYTIVGSRSNATVGDDKTDCPLFGKVDGATFEYLYFLDFRVEEDITNGGKLGLIAKEAENSNFTNLGFEEISIFEDNDYAGVIAGTAKNCHFTKILSKFSDVTVDGWGAGGLVGQSENSEFETCMISISSAAYADGSYDARAGGVVGESKNDNFVGCVNAGLVGGKADELGGIAGRSENSRFTSCNNEYAILFCDAEGSGKDKLYFRNLVDKTRENIHTMALQQKNDLDAKIVGLVAGVGSGIIAAMVADVLVWSSKEVFYIASGYPLSAYLDFLTDLEFNLADLALEAFSSTICTTAVFAIVVATVVAAVVYSIIFFTDYDEVGGICGYAKRSIFEHCTNNAKLLCDDESCGGIVGAADECIINNCLNTGDLYNQGAGTIGGIVGHAIYNVKINNCLSTEDYPIIGFEKSYDQTDGKIDPTSGNNYRYANPDRPDAYANYEMQVMFDKIGTGVVANWLNNGPENRSLTVKPWRQTLRGTNPDMYPVLDLSHDAVLPTNLNHKNIRTEEDLRAFAQNANSGETFCNAVLENDIVMTDAEPWTPIGTEANRWRGVFDGQGHTISGLKCSVGENSAEGAGLFGTIDVHADIRNVTLAADCEMLSNSATGAGGIVGSVKNTNRGWGVVNIRGCGNYGKVTGYQHIGGILGRVDNDNKDTHVQVVVDNCFNAGTVTANGYGGLISGYMQSCGIVANCWSSGALKQRGEECVFSKNNPSGELEYFVGYDQTVSIESCYDYQSDVDWFGFAEDQRNQQGVTKTTNALPSCTVTFDAGSGTCATTSLTDVRQVPTFHLPAVTPLEGWTFAGWATAAVAETTEKPTTIVGQAAETYHPTASTVLYAIYSKDIQHSEGAKTLYQSVPENVTVTVGTAQFATLYYSAQGLVVPEGLEAITYSYTGGNTISPKVSYKSGMMIPKDEAVVLHATETLSGATPFVFAVTRIEETKADGNVLEGTDIDMTIYTTKSDKYIYRLLNGSNGVGFYRTTEENGQKFTNEAHKAYLVATYDADASGTASAPLYISLLPDGDATAISTVAEERTSDATLYNLMGQKVGRNYRGMVIQKGRKTLKTR